MKQWTELTLPEQNEALNRMVREVYPDIPEGEAGDDQIGYLLWNHTGFPYWYYPDEQGGPIGHFRRQLEDWRDGKVDEIGNPVEGNK